MNNSKSDSYKAAGVDITAGYQAVERIKSHVARTSIPGVLGGLGGFGGLFAPTVQGMAQPVLVSGADGVGTKLKLAFLMDKHDTVGIDCVAMCVNDILCAGATPLFFLDYIACGKNVPQRIEAVVSGIAEGCVQAGCALVGGETAEMPGFYPEDEYDLAGFAVGLVDQPKMLDKALVKKGDALIALKSSGVHSNGFSLVRKVFELDAPTAAPALTRHYGELGGMLGEALLCPTRIYVKPVLALMAALPVHGVAHITGGGLYENLPRMLPAGLSARVYADKLEVPPLFRLIQRLGEIPEHDMFNTFNMGTGLWLAVDAADADKAVELLRAAGEEPAILGEVVEGDEGVLL